MGGNSFENTDQIDRFTIGQMACGHRATADHEGGDVGSECAHEHAGNDLVAVGDADQGVKAVGLDHGFHTVSNNFPTGERVLHPSMTHGNAVADADGVEFKGDAAGLSDGFLDKFSHFVEMNMAGNDFIKRVADSDEGFLEVTGFYQTGCPQKAPVRRAFGSQLDLIAIHYHSFRENSGVTLPDGGESVEAGGKHDGRYGMATLTRKKVLSCWPEGVVRAVFTVSVIPLVSLVAWIKVVLLVVQLTRLVDVSSE